MHGNVVKAEIANILQKAGSVIPTQGAQTVECLVAMRKLQPKTVGASVHNTNAFLDFRLFEFPLSLIKVNKTCSKTDEPPPLGSQ